MENRVLSWVTSTLQQCATKYFHCIMIPKAEGPLRRTHPVGLFCPSPPNLRILKAQEEFPPLERDAISSTHNSIQLISKAKDPLPSHSTKPREGWKKEHKPVPIKNQKGINHIHLVSVHSIQHTFWPSPGWTVWSCGQSYMGFGVNGVIKMCKEKATGVRLRVKAVVMQTRDDTSDVSGFTRVSNLTAPLRMKRRESGGMVKL